MNTAPSPAISIEPAHSIMEKRGDSFYEVEIPNFVKISTSFKDMLPEMDGIALKVWLFIALSVNRYSNRANPGLRTIAKGTHLAVNTVREAVQRLEKRYKLLTVDRESRKYNIYEPTAFVSARRESATTNATSEEPESDMRNTVSINNTDGEPVSEIRKTVLDDDKTVSVEGESVSAKGESVSARLILNQINQKNQSNQTNQIYQRENFSKTKCKEMMDNMNLESQVFAREIEDPVIQGHAHEIEQVRLTWEKIVQYSRFDAPGWRGFDEWLLRQEKTGKPVEKFCRWFVSDAFRLKSVGNWSPDGDKNGRYSWKAIYAQAFQSTEPDYDRPEYKPYVEPLEDQYVIPDPSGTHFIKRPPDRGKGSVYGLESTPTNCQPV